MAVKNLRSLSCLASTILILSTGHTYVISDILVFQLYQIEGLTGEHHNGTHCLFQLHKLVTRKSMAINWFVSLIWTKSHQMNPNTVNLLKRQINVNAKVCTDFAAALLPRLLGNNIPGHTTLSDHRGATGNSGKVWRLQTGDQQYPGLCHCQLGQYIIHWWQH